MGEKGVLLTWGIGKRGTLEGRQGAYLGQDCRTVGGLSQMTQIVKGRASRNGRWGRSSA